MAEPNIEAAKPEITEAERCCERARGELAAGEGGVGEAPNYLIEAKSSIDRALAALGVPGYGPNEATTGAGV